MNTRFERVLERIRLMFNFSILELFWIASRAFQLSGLDLYSRLLSSRLRSLEISSLDLSRPLSWISLLASLV